MIRTLLKPDNQNISIKLPQHFIGKQVELIAFTIDEAKFENKLDDRIQTHFASQTVLAKEWLTPEEDKAWLSL